MDRAGPPKPPVIFLGAWDRSLVGLRGVPPVKPFDNRDEHDWGVKVRECCGHGTMVITAGDDNNASPGIVKNISNNVCKYLLVAPWHVSR